jgi:hypothetical protein
MPCFNSRQALLFPVRCKVPAAETAVSLWQAQGNCTYGNAGLTPRQVIILFRIVKNQNRIFPKNPS